MPTVTLGDLRARIRSMADMEGSGFIQDAKYSLDAYINSAARTLYDIIAQYSDSYSKSATLVVASTTAPTPADFRLMVSLELNGSPVRQYGYNQRYSEWCDYVPKYRLETGQIRFSSAPATTDVATLFYFPVAPTLTLPVDTLEVFEPGWDDFVVYDAAMMAQQKEERDSSFMSSRRQEVAQRIQSLASSKSLTGVQQAADVIGDWRSGYDTQGGWYW